MLESKALPHCRLFSCFALSGADSRRNAVSASRSNWFREFQSWVRQESPLDEWVYRGQAAKYPSVTPALLRDRHRALYGNRLYFLEPRVVFDLLDKSGVFGPETLYPGVTNWNTDLDREGFVSYLAQNDSANELVAFSELMASLVQHYGFPTLFVDLSLDPLVSAAFATHELSDQGYSVSGEEGILYRWPARRLSRGRLQIPQLGERVVHNALVGAPEHVGRSLWEKVGDDPYLQVLATMISGQQQPEPTQPIKAVDLSGIHPLMRRPRNQSAVLASPVFLPTRLPTPEGLTTPGLAEALYTHIDDLEFVDMRRLPGCESFSLPPDSGTELCEQTGFSMEALFPDRIDLGYSYLSVMALQSIVSSFPTADHDEVLVGADLLEAGRKAFQRGIEVSRMLLDRECFRLIPDMPITHLASQFSADDVLIAFLYQIEAAEKAVELVESGENRERVDAGLAHIRDQAVAELRRNRSKLIARLRENVELDGGPGRWENIVDEILLDPTRAGEAWTKTGTRDTSWIKREIEDRFARVRRILDAAEMVPAFAIEKPDDYEGMLDVFDSDPSHEEEISNQISAQRRWRPGETTFPPLRPNRD